MSSQNLYLDPAPLDRNAHKNLRFKPLQSFDYASHLHASVLAGNEFFAASHDFPVVFIKNSKGEVTPIAVLSLVREGHSLGDWKELYVPASVRRYPFVMDSKDSVLYFDQQCGALQEGEGEPLFNEEGEPSQFLNEVLVFNKNLDDMLKMTGEFAKTLEEKELLEPYKGQVRVNDQVVKLEHYLVVNEKKFHETLSEEEIVDWYRKGWIAWTYAHLSSLKSMSKVVARLPRTEPEASAEA